MITKDNLPESYRPFSELTLCGNRIIGYKNVVSIGNTIPLVVGSGEKPMIWLQAVSDPIIKKFITVVEASISMHPAITILEENDVLSVRIGDMLLLRIKDNKDGSAIIDRLDMRPLGINIVGDGSVLHAGGITLSNNTFQNVETIIALAN